MRLSRFAISAENQELVALMGFQERAGRSVLSVEIDLRASFEADTLAELAPFLASQADDPTSGALVAAAILAASGVSGSIGGYRLSARRRAYGWVVLPALVHPVLLIAVVVLRIGRR